MPTESILFFVNILTRPQNLHCFRHFFHSEDMTCFLILHFPYLSETSLSYHMVDFVVTLIRFFSDGLEMGFNPVLEGNTVTGED